MKLLFAALTLAICYLHCDGEGLGEESYNRYGGPCYPGFGLLYDENYQVRRKRGAVYGNPCYTREDWESQTSVSNPDIPVKREVLTTGLPDRAVKDILNDMETVVGANCNAILICNAFSDPTPRGRFGKKITEFCSKNKNLLKPANKNERACNLAITFKDGRVCRQAFSGCDFTDDQLKRLVDQYNP